MESSSTRCPHSVTAALDQEGYVVVPHLKDPSWLSRAREIEWLQLAEHPMLTAAANHVLARPFRLRDVQERNPRPGFGQQGLHADWPPRAAGDPYFVLTAIWMIDDFTADN